MNLLTKFESKEIKAEDAVHLILSDSTLISQLFEGLMHPKAHVKYPCSKTLMLLSESNPELIYSFFNQILLLLKSDNNIFLWNSIAMICNLSKVDDQNLINHDVLNTLFGLLEHESMITASNVVNHNWKIAISKPQYAHLICSQTFRVETIKRNPECMDILCGQAIDAFTQLYPLCEENNQKMILDFIRRQYSNQRTSVPEKAKKFIEKFSQ